MNFKIAIFDLDGTLVDSLEAISKLANLAFEEMGLKTYSLEMSRTLIGHGVAGIADKALPEGSSLEQKEKLVEVIRKYYEKYWDYNLRLYDGIPELLDKLTEKGILLAINTNKDQGFADETVEKTLKKWNFTHITGAVDGMPRKPNPDGIEAILRDHGIKKEEALYIGDMKVDVETAKNAGVYGVFCEWGFGSSDTLDLIPDLTVKKPEEILKIIQE
jgi:phosphoglycolate phosphatase